MNQNTKSKLDERLVMGEITVEEHQEILHLLTADESPQSLAPHGGDRSKSSGSIGGWVTKREMVIDAAADLAVPSSVIAALLCAVTMAPKHFPGISLRQPVTVAVNIIVLSVIVMFLGSRLRTAGSKIKRAHKSKSKLLIAASYGSTVLTIGLMTVLCIVVAFFIRYFPTGAHS